MDDNLSEKALEVLLKEYDQLKSEISDRLKIAFSHVAYAGAIAVFAFPAAEHAASWVPEAVPLLVAVAGACGLIWVAALNMRWVQHCGHYLKSIESRVNNHFGTTVLGWEHYAASVQACHWTGIPQKPSVEEISLASSGRDAQPTLQADGPASGGPAA